MLYACMSCRTLLDLTSSDLRFVVCDHCASVGWQVDSCGNLYLELTPDVILPAPTNHSNGPSAQKG